MVTYYLILDYFYVCTCTKGGDTTLSCGDSFCSGCTVKLIQEKKFYKKTINLFRDEVGRQIVTKIKIPCPRCLMKSEISNSA